MNLTVLIAIGLVAGHVAGGHGSMIFIFILKTKGYENLLDAEGGFASTKNRSKI